MAVLFRPSRPTTPPWVTCALAAALALALSSCILDSLAPEVGQELVFECSDEDSDPSRPVSFQRDIVEGIFERDITGCNYCHTPDGPIPIGLQVGQLDVSSHELLLQGGLISRSSIVLPGRPCDSILTQKIAPSAPFGGQMPLNGPPYLSAAEQQLIHDWIAEGALDN